MFRETQYTAKYLRDFETNIFQYLIQCLIELNKSPRNLILFTLEFNMVGFSVLPKAGGVGGPRLFCLLVCSIIVFRNSSREVGVGVGGPKVSFLLNRIQPAIKIV